MEKIKVLFVSSEVSPFAKVGGLADVVGRFLLPPPRLLRVFRPPRLHRRRSLCGAGGLLLCCHPGVPAPRGLRHLRQRLRRARSPLRPRH